MESQDHTSQNQHPNSSQMLPLVRVTTSSSSAASNSEGSVDPPTTDIAGNTSSTRTLHPKVLWFDHNPVVRDVTQSIRSRYDGPYTSWSTAPAHVKEAWWEHFRDRYRWDQSVAGAVKRDYERKAAIRLKDMAYKLSKAGAKKVRWCSPTVREQLKQHRASQGFQKKSQLFSANKTSGPHSGTLHSQGSISTAEVIRRLTKELGRAPTAAEVFERSHRTKDNKFVDERAEAVSEEYQRLKHLRDETLQDTQKTRPTDNELFLQAAGGWTQKGIVYGLGSCAHIFYERPPPSSSQSVDSSSKSTDIIQLQQQIKDLKSSYEQQLAQQRKRGTEMEERLEQQRKEMEEQKLQVASLKSTIDQLSQFMQSCSNPGSQFQPQLPPPPPPPPPSSSPLSPPCPAPVS